jgi:hypothetical protein
LSRIDLADSEHCALPENAGDVAGAVGKGTHGKAAVRTDAPRGFCPNEGSVGAVLCKKDVAVLGGLGLMVWNPLVAGVVFLTFLGMSAGLTPKLFRRSKAFLWFMLHKVKSVFSEDEQLNLLPDLSADRSQALSDSLGGKKPDVLWSAQVVTGKAKGFKAIGGQTFGTIGALADSPKVLHFVGRRFWRTITCPIPLENAEIVQEPRFLSQDVVVSTNDGSRKLHLRLHAGKRSLAEKIVEGIRDLKAAGARKLETADEELAVA